MDDARSPAYSTTATSVGAGEINTVGTPARRHRSTTTSRACHVGDRSSCSASSCSSTTTAAAIPAHGAHAAERGPITTSTPAAAAAQSSTARGHRQPGPRESRATPPALRRGVAGPPARVGPNRTADNNAGITSERGGSRSTPPRRQQRVVAGDFGPTAPRTRPSTRAAVRRRRASGDAVTRNGRIRRAAQRTDAHSGEFEQLRREGPAPVTLAIGFSDSTGRPPAVSSSVSSMTHPPIRRPCSSTRTIVPTSHGRRQIRRERDSRTPCRAP